MSTTMSRKAGAIEFSPGADERILAHPAFARRLRRGRSLHGVAVPIARTSSQLASLVLSRPLAERLARRMRGGVGAPTCGCL